jgi:predicted lipid-binding transport protein (Tim44 family)
MLHLFCSEMGCDNIRAMKALFRSLLLWLLLLALPFQGVASASMLLCAPLAAAAQPASQAQAMPAGHDHAAMLAAAKTHNPAADAAQSGAGHDSAGGHGQSGAKCGTPGACCVGASLVADISVAVPSMPSGSQPVPFRARILRAVDLAGFERPPKYFLA